MILFKMPYCISLWRAATRCRARARIPLPFSELVLFIRILGICLSCFVESTFHFIQTKEALTHTVTELQDRQGCTTHVWVLPPSGFLSAHFIRIPSRLSQLYADPCEPLPNAPPAGKLTLCRCSPASSLPSCFSHMHLCCSISCSDRRASNERGCKVLSRENTSRLLVWSLSLRRNDKTPNYQDRYILRK